MTQGQTPQEVFQVMTSEIFNQKGFSLIELLMVFAVIAMLTGFAVFGLSGFKEGSALKASRDEAALVIERTRSVAIYTNDEVTFKFDSATQTFWSEDKTGKKVMDPEKAERGIVASGPAGTIFKGTGGLKSETETVYTFQEPKTGKTRTLKIHPKTGRVEKEE